MVLKHISEQLPRRRSGGVFGVTLRGRRANPSGGLPRVRIDTIKLAVRAQFRAPGVRGGASKRASPEARLDWSCTRHCSVKCAESGETADGRARGIGPWVTECRDRQRLGAGRAGCEGSSRLFHPVLTNHLYWFERGRGREGETGRGEEHASAPKEKFTRGNVNGKSATIWGSRTAVLGRGGLYRCHKAAGRSAAIWLCAPRGPPPPALLCPLLCPGRVLEHVLHTTPRI